MPALHKNSYRIWLIFRGALLGILLGAAMSVLPICGIRRATQPVFSQPAQVIFFAEWLIVCAITGGVLLPKFAFGDPLLDSLPESLGKPKRLFKQLMMPVAALLFLLLYFAASGLCQRLDMGVIRGGQTTVQIFRFLGLSIATAGLLLQSYALLASAKANSTLESGNGYVHSPFLKLRHPCFFATLVTLIGIPLVLGTWYPLFALPGIFIVMKWIVAEQEKVLLEKLGAAYEQYQSSTRRLLPYFY